MEKVEQLRLENVREEKVPQPPAVELLWVFSCELTRGLSVNTMAWNKKNPVSPIQAHLKTPRTLSILYPSLHFLNSRQSFAKLAKSLFCQRAQNSCSYIHLGQGSATQTVQGSILDQKNKKTNLSGAAKAL